MQNAKCEKGVRKDIDFICLLQGITKYLPNDIGRNEEIRACTSLYFPPTLRSEFPYKAMLGCIY